MKNTLNNELAVCGFAAVKAIEEKNPGKIRRLYFTKERCKEFGNLCKYLAANKVPYNIVTNEDLEKLCGSVHHQNVVAMIQEVEIPRLNKNDTTHWVAEKENVLLLDRVGNANNLGAIVRSAAFFGCKNIVIPLDEAQSSVTTSSYRVAQGGMEFVKIYSVKSIEKLLVDMKDRMYRIGTAVDAKTPVRDMNRLRKDKPALIVLGNEEHGISETVKRNCDQLVIIPFSGESACVESLNVAQAASIVLYELTQTK